MDPNRDFAWDVTAAGMCMQGSADGPTIGARGECFAWSYGPSSTSSAAGVVRVRWIIAIGRRLLLIVVVLVPTIRRRCL